MLTNSLGKCNSIRDIVFHEYETSDQNLRSLVLTDYIRKEYEKAIGNTEYDVNSLGVLPFLKCSGVKMKEKQTNSFWSALRDDRDHSGGGKRGVRAGDRNEWKSHIQQDRKSS